MSLGIPAQTSQLTLSSAQQSIMVSNTYCTSVQVGGCYANCPKNFYNSAASITWLQTGISTQSNSWETMNATTGTEYVCLGVADRFGTVTDGLCVDDFPISLVNQYQFNYDCSQTFVLDELYGTNGTFGLGRPLVNSTNNFLTTAWY